jgi:hypothetical protein
MYYKFGEKFDLGLLLITPAAEQAIHESGNTPIEFIERHARGDWGELCEADRKANERALQGGSRIFSTYHTSRGDKLWVITEADRRATTILLPEEY